jgi:alkylated DNA repair dioxygenase AlkB
MPEIIDNMDVETKINILPYDGTVYYIPKFFNEKDAQSICDKLFANLDWQPDQAIIYGKNVMTKRKIAWFSDHSATFSYSGITRLSKTWDPLVLEIKKQIEQTLNYKFNSCLLNLYHNGIEGMGWHSDKTKEFGDVTTIATLSLGTKRRFDFKHIKTGQKVSIQLEPGSLLVMTDNTQVNWLHQLPKTTKVKDGRISLTFRQLL